MADIIIINRKAISFNTENPCGFLYNTTQYFGTTGETRRRKTTGPEMAASCINAVSVVPAQAKNVWAFLLYIEEVFLCSSRNYSRKKKDRQSNG